MTGINFARRLRGEQTLPEARLWTLLRGRRLNGLKFRRQVPIDRYVADFACFDARLIIELDGAVHDDQELYDLERTGRLEACGWQVLRFSNEQVLRDPGSVLDAISAEIRLARP